GGGGGWGGFPLPPLPPPPSPPPPPPGPRAGGGGGGGGPPPPHKGGPTRPDRPNCSGQWLVVREGASSTSGLRVDWTWLRCYPRDRKVHPHIGMQVSGKWSCLNLAHSTIIGLRISRFWD
ncbi:MAG: hypothetical protein F4Z82_00370, partial [Caldilineaceae bacterium SB0668_bin_21]|nr:hypothetical protein [Caldilineaceae bacterium SB0668_bin_21]